MKNLIRAFVSITMAALIVIGGLCIALWNQIRGRKM